MLQWQLKHVKWVFWLTFKSISKCFDLLTRDVSDTLRDGSGSLFLITEFCVTEVDGTPGQIQYKLHYSEF